MRERLPRVPVRARARAWRRCVRTFWLAPWAVRRARVAPVLHRRLWIDAGCVAYGGGCSIDFARAPASRGGCWPAIARGTALRDGEEARPRPGARPMHRRSAPLQAAVVRQFTPCNARARGVLRAWARPRGSAQGACQAARPSEQSGGLQAAHGGRSTSHWAAPKRRRAAGGGREGGNLPKSQSPIFFFPTFPSCRAPRGSFMSAGVPTPCRQTASIAQQPSSSAQTHA